jgi:hypothetical protein
MPNPEDFEAGLGGWWVDRGVWEIGTPDAGPGAAHSGLQCAGTVLDGNYPADANTRLISPEVFLDGGPELFFWHWFRFEVGDEGRVEISVNGENWQSVPGFGGPFSGNSNWTQGYVPLTDFIGSTIRIGFRFTSNGFSGNAGWYLDDIRIEGTLSGIQTIGIEEVVPRLFIVPNPASGPMEIRFELLQDGPVQVLLFNAEGRFIRNLLETVQRAGAHSLMWDGRNASRVPVGNGVYFCRLVSSRTSATTRVVIDGK